MSVLAALSDSSYLDVDDHSDNVVMSSLKRIHKAFQTPCSAEPYFFKRVSMMSKAGILMNMDASRHSTYSLN